MLIIICVILFGRVSAQTDTNSIVIHKDPRVDLLVKKQIQINEETTRESRSHVPGYRIQVINSPDRNKVFAAKTKHRKEQSLWPLSCIAKKNLYGRFSEFTISH